MNTIAGTTQRSRAQVHPPTAGGCTTAIQYKSTHQLCASQRAVENGDGDCRGWSAELCPTMLLLMVAGGEVHARTMLAEASVREGVVGGYKDEMVEERLVSGAVLPNCWVSWL